MVSVTEKEKAVYLKYFLFNYVSSAQMLSPMTPKRLF